MSSKIAAAQETSGPNDQQQSCAKRDPNTEQLSAEQLSTR